MISEDQDKAIAALPVEAKLEMILPLIDEYVASDDDIVLDTFMRTNNGILLLLKAMVEELKASSR